jgi:hypothetical protein
VTEVLISFQRPASMTELEMRSWITKRSAASQPVLALRRRDGPAHQARLLRAELQAESVEAAEEQLAELMMDMRLLGLRPSIVSSADSGYSAQDGYEYR